MSLSTKWAGIPFLFLVSCGGVNSCLYTRETAFVIMSFAAAGLRGEDWLVFIKIPEIFLLLNFLFVFQFLEDLCLSDNAMLLWRSFISVRGKLNLY